MNKLMAFFAFIYIFFTIMGFISEGGGGLVTTTLTSTIDADDTVVNVTSTSGYLEADTITIEKEQMYYSGTTATSFTGVQRAQDGTVASSHAAGRQVSTKAAGVINALAGFNVGQTASTLGTLKMIAYTPIALTNAVSMLVLGDFSFFEGSLVFLRYFYVAISIGLVAYLMYIFISAFGGLARG